MFPAYKIQRTPCREEFEQLEVAILLEMSNMKEEFYREGFKQGVKFILSMQK